MKKRTAQIKCFLAVTEYYAETPKITKDLSYLPQISFPKGSLIKFSIF